MERWDGVSVGVDTGGTFTDLVLFTPQGIRVHKVPSTPDDPSRAILRGLEELGAPPAARVVHGTTVATNAVLQRRGARTAFLTTEGFRDILHLQRQTRTRLYDLYPTRPEPLVPRELCYEVRERVDRTGAVLEPLDEEGLRGLLAALSSAGVESLAITFLFGFANPAHELRAGELAREAGFSVSLGSEVLPEFREYERASTTAANAYVGPLLDRYLDRLDRSLGARAAASGTAPGPLQIMQSSGGILSAAAARREAVRTILSGPAGGVVGAWAVGRQAGFRELLSFDMGGTSTDVCLVRGEPEPETEGEIDGLPLRVPMLGIHTVGAGGGSLARVEAGRSLRVGPESAGADPGPAAYGKGDRATVTDANLLLGRLLPDRFLGGAMPLYPDRARAAVGKVAAALGLSVDEAAEGIAAVADAQMTRALRKVSVERGVDPRQLCLVAFGGGGPLHACALAEELRIPVVLVPRYPGLLSALGMLLTDPRKEYSRTVMTPMNGPAELLEAAFQALEARARREMEEEGIPPDRIEMFRIVDARFVGQSHELRVPAPSLESGALLQALRRAHRERFGYASDTAAGEVVTVRVQAIGRLALADLPRATVPGRVVPEPVEKRPVRWQGSWREATVYEREDLVPGAEAEGPALVLQPDTTTWLPPGWRLSVDGGYNLVVRRREAGGRERD